MSTQYVDLPVEEGVVTSINGETGAITLVAGTGIVITPAGQNITIAASGTSTVNTRTTTVSTVVSPSDDIIFCNNSAPISITLPIPTAGRVLTIKDIAGTAGTNNITILRNGTEMIEKLAASYLIQGNFVAVELSSDGTNWWLI